MIRVLIADDHPVVTDGLTRFLEAASDVHVVGTAITIDELRAAVGRSPTDVLILDLNMPGNQGIATIRELSRIDDFPAIIVFSMHEEDGHAVELIRAGAKAFFSKARPPDQLLDAIRRAARGERTLTDAITAKLLDAGAAQVAPHEQLSARERAVFQALVEGRHTKRIARDLGVSLSTVHTYTERIKLKLDADTVQDLVRYAFRHGLTS